MLIRAAVLTLALALPAAAESSPSGVAGQGATAPQALDPAPGCNPKSQAQAATAPEPGGGDGTAPGNSGSTGWSGGTGGSHIGTNPSGKLAGSLTWQPPTARGLDLHGVPEPAAC